MMPKKEGEGKERDHVVDPFYTYKTRLHCIMAICSSKSLKKLSITPNPQV